MTTQREKEKILADLSVGVNALLDERKRRESPLSLFQRVREYLLVALFFGGLLWSGFVWWARQNDVWREFTVRGYWFRTLTVNQRELFSRVQKLEWDTYKDPSKVGRQTPQSVEEVTGYRGGLGSDDPGKARDPDAGH